MIFLTSETSVWVVFGFTLCSSSAPFSSRDLRPCSQGCGKMAAVPIGGGAHAAFKVRDKLGGGPPGPDSRSGRQFTPPSAHQTTLNEAPTSQPVQYNAKIMNAIWGMYNRYSVHNIKSHIAHNDI